MGAKVPPTLSHWRAQPRPHSQQHPHTRPPRRERHTSVRTDDDSGLDTLWLLKKMDSRSENTNREKPVRSSKKRWRLHRPTPGGSTPPATGDGGQGSLQAQHPAAATWGPSELGTPTPRRHYTMVEPMPNQSSRLNSSSHIKMAGLMSLIRSGFPQYLRPHYQRVSSVFYGHGTRKGVGGVYLSEKAMLRTQISKAQ